MINFFRPILCGQLKPAEDNLTKATEKTHPMAMNIGWAEQPLEDQFLTL